MKQEKRSLADIELILKTSSRLIEAGITALGLERKGIDPEDVIQEVRIKIWKTLDSEKNIHDLSSYIMRTMNSALIDHIRTFRRQQKLLQYEEERCYLDKRTHFKNTVPENILSDVVGEAVNSLIESRRKVVKLFLLNLTLEEISLFLNLSKSKTRNLLYRGLADLRKKLSQWRIGHGTQ